MAETKLITTLRLSPNVLRRLKRLADMREVTRSSLINTFIAEGLRREENRREPRLNPPTPELEVTAGALD